MRLFKRHFRILGPIAFTLWSTLVFGQATIDVAGADYTLGNSPGGSPQEFHTISATVNNAQSSVEAEQIILKGLSSEQLQNTIVFSGDPLVAQDLLNRYGSTHSIDSESPAAPAFFPAGKLAENEALHSKLLKTNPKLSRVWNDARRLGQVWKESLSSGSVERIKFLTDPDKRVDAVYFTVITGLVSRGWLFVRATNVTPAQFHITVATASNLVFFQALRLVYSIVPNRFAATTAWTTHQLRRAFGQDLSVPASKAWAAAGNATTQLGINVASVALNALVPNNPFLSSQNAIAVLLNTFTGTATDLFVQAAYGHFEKLKVETGSDLPMTDYFLRRLGMVSGVLATWLAPLSELQQMKGRAWLVQGLEVALWAYVANNFDHVSSFAEKGIFTKYAFKSEKIITQAPVRFLRKKFERQNCLSILAK